MRIAHQAPRVGRSLRNPMHRFNLENYPYQLQPFMLAPVLPGETLKNALIQSRVVTSPINNPLIGWHQEYWFFYVKHRDLDGRDDFTDMMLDLNKSMTAYVETADVKYNHQAGTFNWAKLCLKRVVETYFREEGQAWNTYMIDGLPAAGVNVEGFWQSSQLSDNIEAPVDVSISTAGDNAFTVGELDRAQRTYEFQKMHGFTEMSYEDWLATYGIKSPKVELHHPELLRYIKEWQYPSNTIDPATGAPSSAVSWAIRDSVNKDRFFREPGFIIGITCCRPKVYFRNIDGNGADLLMNALAWLPAIMRDDPATSTFEYTDATGPMAGVVADTDGYWVDLKDLFIHGDDFLNYSRTAGAAGKNIVALPTANLLNKEYVSLSDVEGLFVGTTSATRMVRQDGVVSLSILGSIEDTTPGSSMGS